MINVTHVILATRDIILQYITKGQKLSDDQALEFLAVEQTVPEQ